MGAAQRQPDRGKNPKPRERAWRPKSTTGCFTCKHRRVKCDETKPACKRCTSTGRTCDGYARPHQLSSSPTPSPSFDSSLTSSWVLTGPFSSKEEGEGFEFFQNIASKDICGCFGSPFWQCELLQATHYHPAIRHGVIALGTLYRRYTTCSDDVRASSVLDKQLLFALDQSNKAIQKLVSYTQASPPSETNLKTIITCCILFSTLACLQGEQQEALNHIRCGVKLMKELTALVFSLPDPMSTLYSHPVSLKSLRRTFLSLNVQALSILNATDLNNWEMIPAYFLENCHAAPPEWGTLDCAVHYFESLLSNVLAFIQGSMEYTGDGDLGTWDYSTPELVVEHLHERLQFGVRRLHKTFPEVFCEGADADAIVLRLMCSQVELFLMVFCSEDKAHGTEDEEPFEALMNLVARLEGSLDRRPVYTSTYGMLSTLFMVATRASSLRLRKKAIGILLEHPRRDGLWDGPWAGRIAQEALKLEETAAREELGIDIEVQPVPSELRVRDIHISYPTPRQTRVKYLTERAIANGESGRVRYFTG